jgi:hypothetical protein
MWIGCGFTIGAGMNLAQIKAPDHQGTSLDESGKTVGQDSTRVSNVDDKV